jgi:hypothetical protein
LFSDRRVGQKKHFLIFDRRHKPRVGQNITFEKERSTSDVNLSINQPDILIYSGSMVGFASL